MSGDAGCPARTRTLQFLTLSAPDALGRGDLRAQESPLVVSCPTKAGGPAGFSFRAGFRTVREISAPRTRIVKHVRGKIPAHAIRAEMGHLLGLDVTDDEQPRIFGGTQKAAIGAIVLVKFVAFFILVVHPFTPLPAGV